MIQPMLSKNLMINSAPDAAPNTKDTVYGWEDRNLDAFYVITFLS